MRVLSVTVFRCALILLILLLVIPLRVQLVTAQSVPNIPKPHTPRPPLPAADQEQFIPYWTSETGWTSELQLKNNAAGSDLTVTPALRLPDGTESPLVAITIKPQEVQLLDINSAISTAGAPQLVGTFGSLVLRYRSPSPATLYAAVMIHGTGHPIAFHIDGMGESPGMQSGGREGIWWLPKDTTSDYLVVTNQGKAANTLDLSLFDASGNERKQKLQIGPGATTRYSIRKLVLGAGLNGNYGGLKISANSHAGSLDTLHFLYDESAGFSALLKMFDYNPKAKLEERDYARTSAWTLRAPMLALTNPDPALAFPPGTKLQPQLFVRNTTAKILDASLRFNWRTSSAAGKALGPALRLNPHETRRVDLASLQGTPELPMEANWTSVTITTNAEPDELVAVAASYDSTLRYGAETPFSDQLTFKWEGGMWEYDAYHNSFITAGNGGTQPTQAAFTLFYNQGAQKYEMEQTLQPDEQMWIDVGKLIREHLPDKNGSTLPADLTSGSYEIRELTHTGAGTLFEGKVIFDKMYGHVTYGCAACCGYGLNALFWYDPFGLPLGVLTEQGVDAPDECNGGALADVSNSFYNNWSTATPSVATVDAHGIHTGVAPGSTTSYTFGFLNNNDSLRRCPLVQKHPSGGDNVTPRIDLITPRQGAIGTNVPVTISGQGFGTNPTVTVGGGIAALVGTKNDTTISTSFAIPPNATPGSYSVTVSGKASDGTTQTSNSMFFSVIPKFTVGYNAFIAVDHITGPAGCPLTTSTWAMGAEALTGPLNPSNSYRIWLRALDSSKVRDKPGSTA